VMPRWVKNMDIASAWQQRQYDLFKLILPFVAGHAAPLTTGYGDLFHEGKDMRARYHGYKPGVLSDRLRQALDMGPSELVPPPWLTGMQRVARLPPRYPHLKIPGMNAPIPSGARYGRGRNEWGEPPRDPNNNNKFLFEGVDRSSATLQDIEEKMFVSAKWGKVTSFSVFTASQEEMDQIRERQEMERREQEAAEKAAREAEEQQRLLMLQQQQQRAQQHQQNLLRAGTPVVQVPQHLLQAAGIYQQQQPQMMMMMPGNNNQFGIQVNVQGYNPLLNAAGVPLNNNNNQR
jgi:hypothetical protein